MLDQTSTHLPRPNRFRALRRQILSTMAWLFTTIAFYLGVLGLEAYWNLVNWRAKLDLVTVSLFAWMSLMLMAFFFLTRRCRDRLSQSMALVCCAGLVLLGIYTLPAEPLSEGLFGRNAASPLWYRTLRLVCMSLPAVFWGCNVRKRQPPGL